MATEFPYLCLTAAMETETGRRVLKQYLTQLGYITRAVTDSNISEQIKPYFDAFASLRNSVQDTMRMLSALRRRVSVVWTLMTTTFEEHKTRLDTIETSLEGHGTRLDTIEKSLELVMSLPAFSTGGATVSVEEEEKL